MIHLKNDKWLQKIRAPGHIGLELVDHKLWKRQRTTGYEVTEREPRKSFDKMYCHSSLHNKMTKTKCQPLLEHSLIFLIQIIKWSLVYLLRALLWKESISDMQLTMPRRILPSNDLKSDTSALWHQGKYNSGRIALWLQQVLNKQLAETRANQPVHRTFWY